MVRVGAHVSIAGSIDKSVDRASDLGCDTFQIFSRNPRGWRFKELSGDVVYEFRRKLEDSGMYPPVDHMPYLPNFASPKEEVLQKSIVALEVELDRCDVLGIPYLVTHLGSHLGSGKEEGLKRTVVAIQEALSHAENQVMLLLEITANTKNSVGGSFQDLGWIMEQVDDADRVGLCFDTCHAFAAGYELRTKEGLENTLEEVERLIGLDQMKVIHLNDSKGELGSKKDRHEHIGLGEIGADGFKVILRNPVIRSRPLILETPTDERRDHSGNIKAVRDLAMMETLDVPD